MYLIPLENDIIYYNVSISDVSSLATIFLLAIAYHPTYSHLLYLLYGNTSSASPGSTYGNINIMVRNMATKQYLQNSTVSQQIGCTRACEIEVTENLFLIESQQFIAIYRLQTDHKVDIGTPYVAQGKNDYLLSGLSRQASIFKNKYVIVSNITSVLTFGSITSRTTVFNISAGVNISDVLFIGMTDKWVFLAVNFSNIRIVFYNCAACIFNGSYISFNDTNRLVVPTDTSVTYNYRLYQGIQTAEGNISNAYIFVGIGDGDSRKYYINQSNDYQQDATVSSYRIAASTQANSYQYVSFGSSLMISRLFAYHQSDQKLQLFSFDTPIYLAALSSDSKVMALHSADNSWNAKQYQIVSDCALYATNSSNITNDTDFCPCIQYDSQNYCAYNGTSTDTSTGSSNSSFPVAAVIGVVVGLVMIAVSVIVVKKNYKKCQKRHRTPWKYNPVELMSFQV